jgi:hypothetical protein
MRTLQTLIAWFSAAVRPLRAGDFDALVAQWLPLTVALNALTASLGHEPAYPFMLGDAVLDKFRLIHRVVHDAPPAEEKT